MDARSAGVTIHRVRAFNFLALKWIHSIGRDSPDPRRWKARDVGIRKVVRVKTRLAPFIGLPDGARVPVMRGNAIRLDYVPDCMPSRWARAMSGSGFILSQAVSR